MQRRKKLLSLAVLIKDHGDALICDLAETYGIWDYRAMPARLVATLALGLRPDSRVYLALSGMQVSYQTVLLASCLDNLAFLAWTKTEGAQRGQNRPVPIAPRFLPEQETEGAYNSPEEFEAAREELLRRIGHGEQQSH